jgi:hypothetical protein
VRSLPLSIFPESAHSCLSRPSDLFLFIRASTPGKSRFPAL